jgi:hypothetical protein
MTTITTLSRADLDELGIDAPREMIDAYQLDDGTISILVPDYDGSSFHDPPNEDHSGDDAWEWISFDSGRERDQWLEDNFCCQECGAQWGAPDEACPSGYEESDKHIYPDAFRPGLDFWIERYEHGLVRYAPIGESSFVDRQWDVAQGVAIFRFKEDHGCGDPNDPEGVLNFVRAVCDEYTAWCNGDYYGIIRWRKVDSTYVLDQPWVEIASCWGFLGYDYAQQTAQTEAF